MNIQQLKEQINKQKLYQILMRKKQEAYKCWGKNIEWIKKFGVIIIGFLFLFISVYFRVGISKYFSTVSGNFAGRMQNVGIALLTLLIPLAIAIISDLYQKRKDPEENFVTLDMNIILNDIFRIKYLLIYIALIFIPMLFWDISNGFFRYIEIILSFIGIYLLTQRLLSVYKWLKGTDYTTFRLNYLKKLKNFTEMEEIWLSIWKTKNIDLNNETNEKKFIIVFIDRIIYLLKNDINSESIYNLLKDFLDNVTNLSINTFIEDNSGFKKVLELNYLLWRKKEENIHLKPPPQSLHWYGISLKTLSSIIKYIGERCLNNGQHHVLTHLNAFYFIDDVKTHVNAKNLQNDTKYLKFLFSQISIVIFENVLNNDYESKDIFPEEWKITIQNLNSYIPKILWNEFEKWAIDRIKKNRINPEHILGDNVLEGTFSNIFPNVSLNILAVILTFFIYLENELEQMISNIVFYGPGFGSSSGTNQNNTDVVNNTYNLACLLFKDKISEDKLKKCETIIENINIQHIELLQQQRRNILNTFFQKYRAKINL